MYPTTPERQALIEIGKTLFPLRTPKGFTKLHSGVVYLTPDKQDELLEILNRVLKENEDGIPSTKLYTDT